MKKAVRILTLLIGLSAVMTHVQSQNWLLNGNSGAGPDALTTSNNFLGSSSGNSVDIKIGTNGNTVMTLTTGGNLGIGTTSPEHALDVAGDANIDTSQVYRIDSLEALDARGIENIFVGMQAFSQNIDTAAFNVFAGVDAGLALTGGSHNTALGWSSGSSITLGFRNALLGSQAGAALTTGIYNTIIGSEAGIVLTIGDDNTFVGARAGQDCTTGGANVLIGKESGSEITTGDCNTITGTAAGSDMTDQVRNTLMGYNAGLNLGTTAGNGNDNTVLGARACVDALTGRELTIVGADAEVGNSLRNATAVGYRAIVEASNSMVLGSIASTNGAGAGQDTNVGIGTTTPDNRLEIVRGAQGNDLSGLRLWSLVGSTPGTPNGEVLTIDSNGDVILVRDSIGSGGIAATDLGNYCSETDNPLSENYEIPLDSANFYFTGQEDWVDNIGMGIDCNESLYAKLMVYQEKWSQEYEPHDPNNSYAGMFIDNAQENTYWAVGVAGISYGEGEWNFGGYFNALDGIDHSIGVYASAPIDSAVNYAGYFNGDLTYTGNLFQTSDRKLKENIEHLKGLDAILQLSPSSYNYSVSKFPSIHLSNDKSYGFVAQELEEVIPDLVSDIIHPAEYGADGKLLHAAIDYKAVNYTGLIPFAIAAIQEQQVIIEEKEVRISKLEKEVERLSNLENEVEAIKEQLAKLSDRGTDERDTDVQVGFAGTEEKEGTELHQNRPNPFRQFTTFTYTLGTSGNVELNIYSMEGVFIDNVVNQFQRKGDYKAEWDSKDIPNGMYFYILTVDGVEWVKKAIRLQ